MIIQGNSLQVLKTLPPKSVHTCVTSPPYWGLRDYGGMEGQIGLEPTPLAYAERLCRIFSEVRRVLRDDGTLWLNLGDTHASGRGAGAGVKSKDLVGVPWMVAFALRTMGWHFRMDIIWHKPNPMPESVSDRPVRAHEYIFLFSKNEDYYYDIDATRVPYKEASVKRMKSGWAGNENRDFPGGHHNNISQFMGTEKGAAAVEKGANRRSVWTVTTRSFKGGHCATFPPELIEPCILAGAPPGGTVLDPFNGAATTGLVAQRLGREYIGIELNPEYIAISEKRLAEDAAERGR